MLKNSAKQNILALMAATIWGTAFVAQSVAAEYLQPFSFNAARAYVGGLVLLPVWFLFAQKRKSQGLPGTVGTAKDLALGGFLCGTVLVASVCLQQAALETTTAGKVGFITALYIVIVPVCGVFLKKLVPKTVWMGVVLAVGGLYFLCINESLTIAQGDFYTLLCAFCFSVHILVVDHFTQKVDGVALCCIQLFVTAIWATFGALIWEAPTWAGLSGCIWQVLYVGVFSSGVAYTLQILAQKDSNPTVISLILSLEAVVAVVAGALILGDQLSTREYVGCLLMMLAVVLAQLPDKSKQIVN